MTHIGGGASSQRIARKFIGSSGSLLKVAARRGFKGLTITHLRKLYSWLDIKDDTSPRLLTKVPLLHSLCNHIMGNAATEAFMKIAILSRHVADSKVDALFKDGWRHHEWRAGRVGQQRVPPGR